MIQPKKEQLDGVLAEVVKKIDAGTVTCEDFNDLIIKTMIGESTPEAIRDRMRRRTLKNATDSHQDNVTGHQQLQPPTMAARVQPKRAPQHQQSHGRAGIAHDHSARTQQRTMSASLKEATVPDRFRPALEFIADNIGEPLTEEVMLNIPDKFFVKALAGKLLSRPGLDRDWLYALVQKLG